MKKFLTLFIGLVLSANIFAQDLNPNRYRESIFPDVLSISDVKYGEAPQWVFPYWDIDLELDVYVPDGDLNPKRPLIIFAHSGGFINGSKDVDNMVAICDSFARKGYVTASIDYRKGFDPLDSESAERAVYRSVQDGKAAVRYFKENASLYDIDTNNVFFGGMSAGGYIALHVAYMDKESERPESTYGGGLVNDLECLDCAGNDFDQGSNVRAILDFWGGVDDTTIIEEGGVPVLIMHGENDETVPFVYGHPFGLFTLPESYGGQPISERADNMGIQYEFFTSEGPLHMLDGSDNGSFDGGGPNSFWSDTLLPNSERFLYEIIKPYTIQLSDDSIQICAPYGWVDMLVSDGEGSQYVWDYDEASINIISGENTNDITFEFMEAGDFEITVVEFNEILCAGDTIVFNVHVEMAYADYSYSYIEPNYVAFTNIGGDPENTYTWNFGDGETSDEFEPSHVYESIGAYEVLLHVLTPGGCIDTVKSIVDIDALSISTNDAQFIALYPNPFNKQFTIQSETELAQITVMDAYGRLVYAESQFNSGLIEIDANTWSNGIYFITIQNLNGQLLTKKIIKN